MVLAVLFLWGCPRFQQGPLKLAPDRLFVTVGSERIYVQDRGKGEATAAIPNPPLEGRHGAPPFLRYVGKED